MFHGRAVDALVALCGLAVIFFNKRFADASVKTSQEVFGISLREGTRAYKINRIYSRSLAILVGTVMFIGGTLGALRVDWRSLYQ